MPSERNNRQKEPTTDSIATLINDRLGRGARPGPRSPDQSGAIRDDHANLSDLRRQLKSIVDTMDYDALLLLMRQAHQAIAASGSVTSNSTAIDANGRRLSRTFDRRRGGSSLSPSDVAALFTPKAMWSDRDRAKRVTPVSFLKHTYEVPLKAKALTRALLRRFDKPLYLAYSKWIKRHSEDDLHLPTEERTDWSKVDDPLSLLRQRARVASKKYRERSRGLS